MAARIAYLNQSKRGFYEYRRWLPKRLRPAFGGKHEYKKSLETTEHTVAFQRWAKVNADFEAKVKLAEKMLASPNSLNSLEVLDQANRIAEEFGIHPEQAPVLKGGYTEAEYDVFVYADKDYRGKQEDWNWNYPDMVQDKYIDEEQRQKDYETGRWGQPGYQTPYKRIDPRDPLIVAGDIISGDVIKSLDATWRDAFELYLEVNAKTKRRYEHSQKKYESKMRNMFTKFGESLGKLGNRTLLKNITRVQARSFVEGYRAATGNRYNNALSAVVNLYNQENQNEPVANPFSGLANKTAERDEAVIIRSLKPSEFHQYVNLLEGHHNWEIATIGLIMAYTGCRTGEAAGLEMRDIKLTDNIPHIVFRTNQVRRIGKGGLERAVPLMARILDRLREGPTYVDTQAAYFNKYGKVSAFDNVSNQLNSVIKKGVVNDVSVVAYSTRHTFRDRSTAAGIRSDNAEYLMGHLSSGSSRIHKSYGTMTPPFSLYQEMVDTYAQKEWGYYED